MGSYWSHGCWHRLPSAGLVAQHVVLFFADEVKLAPVVHAVHVLADVLADVFADIAVPAPVAIACHGVHWVQGAGDGGEVHLAVNVRADVAYAGASLFHFAEGVAHVVVIAVVIADHANVDRTRIGNVPAAVHVPGGVRAAARFAKVVNSVAASVARAHGADAGPGCVFVDVVARTPFDGCPHWYVRMLCCDAGDCYGDGVVQQSAFQAPIASAVGARATSRGRLRARSSSVAGR